MQMWHVKQANSISTMIHKQTKAKTRQHAGKEGLILEKWILCQHVMCTISCTTEVGTCIEIHARG